VSFSPSLATVITDRIRKVVGANRVQLHEPNFGGNEWKYVKDCLDTGWVSSVGAYVERFERDLADYTGAGHAIAVSNGTSGLHLALKITGVMPDDEVIVPAMTFVATANAVSYCGACPHFADIETKTLGLDAYALAEHLSNIIEKRNGVCVNRQSGRRIAAIVPMHTFGHPVDMRQLSELAVYHDIPIVEDAAESLGSFIEGRHTGTFGVCGVVSFNGNKIITTGGGGALITNDLQLAKRARHLATTAKQPHPWAFIHDQVAYNYRMPNINAALGCAQLEQISLFLDSKRILAERYAQVFADLPEVKIFLERPGTKANYWLQTLILEPEFTEQRDAVILATNNAGFMTRPAWQLLNELPMYRECVSAPIPVAADLAKRIINLPSSPQLIQKTK
jgi:perosamine synthetase